MIEFAIFLSLIIFIFMGIVDYTIESQQAMQVQEAATAGASYGAIPGNQKDLVGMKTAATAAGNGVNGFSATASNIFTCTPGGGVVDSNYSCPSYGTPIMYVQVQTSATVPPILSYPGIAANQQLTGSATFRVPWTP